MVIVYCQKCGVRVPDDEVSSGAAVRDADGNVTCAKCAPASAARKPPSRIMAPVTTGKTGAAPTQHVSSSSRTGIPAARRSARETASSQPPLVPLQSVGGAGAGMSTSLKVGLAVGVAGTVFFVGALLISVFRTKPADNEGAAAATPAQDSPAAQPASQPPETPARPAETAAALDPAERLKDVDKELGIQRAEHAARLLEEAKSFAKGRPDDVRSYREKLAQITATYSSTPAATEATRLLAELPAASAAPRAAGKNLLADPSFESGKWGPWGSWGGTTVVHETDNAHSGEWSVRLNPGKGGCGQKLKGLTPNTTYLLTGFAKTGKGDSVRIGAKEYGGTERAGTVKEEAYTEVSVTFTTGATNTEATIFCYKDGGKSYAYCDDLCVEAQGPAGTETLATQPAAEPAPAVTQAVQPGAAGVLVTDSLAWQAATDLISLLDLDADATPNVWKLQDGALHCGKTGQAKLHLAYQPAAEYDLRVTFARTDGNDVLIQYLTGGSKTFVWVLSAKSNAASGFSQVRGQGSDNNPSTAKLKLDNGRKYTTVVQVRSDGVKAFLDGKLVTQLKTDFKEMNLPGQWKIHDDTALGLGSQNSAVIYHSVELLDMSGKGRALRAARGPAAVAQATEAKTAPAQLSPAEEAKVEYEKAAADVYALLAKDGLAPAQARLQQARADPKLAPMRAALALDAELAQYSEDLHKAALAGAALLVDKRAFTFTMADGKQTRVGKGSSVAVTGVKGEDIQIEQTVGEGRVQAKIEFDHLSPRNRYELMQLGLPPGPEGELRLAYADYLKLQSGEQGVTPKGIRSRLEAAKKGQVPAAHVNQLTERLAFYEFEQGAEAAYHKVDALLKDKKWEEAKAFIEGYRREYVATKALVRLQPTIAQHMGEIELGLSPLKPGLWAAYWSGDGANKFKTFHFGRAETKLCCDWKQGSPDARVPVDNFGIRFAGILRIEKEGKYTLQVQADDNAKVTIDGKKVVESPNKPKEGEATLAKGDHQIAIAYFEGGGSANMFVKWKPEGASEFQEIPAAALWHDSRLTAKYEQQK
ncbi:MAG: PA14 domain-containing protein [Planctomycetota bacterium]|nr:PA14 domain-containing protein [Planctomycetota bacterium]